MLTIHKRQVRGLTYSRHYKVLKLQASTVVSKKVPTWNFDSSQIPQIRVKSILWLTQVHVESILYYYLSPRQALTLVTQVQFKSLKKATWVITLLIGSYDQLINNNFHVHAVHAKVQYTSRILHQRSSAQTYRHNFDNWLITNVTVCLYCNYCSL